MDLNGFTVRDAAPPHFSVKGVIAFFFFFFNFADEQQVSDLITEFHNVCKEMRKLLPYCNEYQRAEIDTRIREIIANYKLFSEV